ncbi:hypothetical protein RvY_04067-2 [Ramazzottius varieornatus]|uniref:Uncharacterized protein n=1 Tax=Ramazzottius varieornatus TaxID=947166 RepID=A0A1D1UQ98_RAMVA|nr:hypothetical protein RvY_04067-2 [Ramazzottius varieornatus]
MITHHCLNLNLIPFRVPYRSFTFYNAHCFTPGSFLSFILEVLWDSPCIRLQLCSFSWYASIQPKLTIICILFFLRRLPSSPSRRSRLGLTLFTINCNRTSNCMVAACSVLRKNP